MCVPVWLILFCLVIVWKFSWMKTHWTAWRMIGQVLKMTTDCKFLPEQPTQCFHSRHHVDHRWSGVSAWWHVNCLRQLLYQRAWLVQLTGEPTSQWTPSEKSSSLNSSSTGCSPVNPLTSIQCQCGSKCGPLTFSCVIIYWTTRFDDWPCTHQKKHVSK